jgi:hypothetical protein
MSKLKILLSSLCLFFLVPAFAQVVEHVPNDVAMAIQFRPSHLQEKVNLKELKQLEVFDMMLETMGGPSATAPEDPIYQMIMEPASYGVDGLSDFTFFLKSVEDVKYYGMAFALTNPGKFADWLQESPLSASPDFEVQELASFNYASLSGGGGLAWNNDIAMLSGAQIDYGNSYFEMSDEDWQAIEQRKDEEAIKWAQIVLNKEFGMSLAQNVRYRKAGVVDTDMHAWIDYSAIMEFSDIMNGMPFPGGGGGMTGMLSGGMLGYLSTLKMLYEDAFLSMGVHFDDGAMRVEQELFGNNKLLNMVEGSMDSKPNKKFLKYIKGDEALGYYTFNINVEKTYEGIKDIVFPMVEEMDEKGEAIVAGLDALSILLDEDAIYELLTGDGLFTVTDVKTVQREVTTYEYDEDFNPTETTKVEEQVVPEFTLLLSYGNEENLKKLINIGLKAKVIEQNGRTYSMQLPDFDFPVKMSMNKGILFISTDEELMMKKLDAGYAGKERLGKEHKKSLKKNGQYMYMDFDRVFKVMEQLSPEEQAASPFADVQKVFESMDFGTKKAVDGSVQSFFNVKLREQDENSLKTLMGFLNDMILGQTGGFKT